METLRAISFQEAVFLYFKGLSLRAAKEKQ